VYFFCVRLRPKKLNSYGLLILGLLAEYFSLALIKRPEEKIHFLEYGLLGFLIYRAFSFRFGKFKLLSFSLSLSSLLGFIDEVIQYFLPNRFYDARDILLNWVASGLGVYFAFIWQKKEHIIFKKT
jgi:VanZ family protein